MNGFLALAILLSAQFGRGTDRVCVYQDIRYEGWAECYYPGDEVATLRNHNDNISSVRVFGRASIVVFDETNFRGQSAEFFSDVPDLGLRVIGGSKSWSDRIESFYVGGDNARRGPGFSRQQQDTQAGICVYEDANYRGRSQCWNVGSQQTDLAQAGRWSDKISSIRVFGRTAVEIYRDHEFNGEHLTIDGDVPDLARVGSSYGNWNDSISSLKIGPERGRVQGRFPFGRGR
jgi:hypothetical protein